MLWFRPTFGDLVRLLFRRDKTTQLCPMCLGAGRVSR